MNEQDIAQAVASVLTGKFYIGQFVASVKHPNSSLGVVVWKTPDACDIYVKQRDTGAVLMYKRHELVPYERAGNRPHSC